jgi:hypothetical protein
VTAHPVPDVDDLADAVVADVQPESNLRRDLAQVINRHSLENRSDTPDFILGDFLSQVLESFDTAVNERANWYARHGNIRPEDSPHVNHAIRELDLCGQTTEDPAYAASIIRTVKEFFSHGHSGGSAETSIWQLYQLLQGHALTALTDDPAEWEDRTEISGTSWWQNRRDGRAMSHDQGKTFWLVDNDPHPDNPQHKYALLAPGGVEAYLLEGRKWWYRSQPARGR